MKYNICARILFTGWAAIALMGFTDEPAGQAEPPESSSLPEPPPPPPQLPDAADPPEDTELKQTPEATNAEKVSERIIKAPVIRRPAKIRSESEKSDVLTKKVLYIEKTSNPLGHGFFWSGLALTLAGGGAITWAMVDQRQKLHDGVLRDGNQNEAYIEQGNWLLTGGEIGALTGGALMTLGVIFWLTDVGETTSEVLPDQAWILPGLDTTYVGIGYDF
jgi:hypothetical protein